MDIDYDKIYARNPEGVTEKLKKAGVAIAGCGGLGSNVAIMLARSGIGKLLLVDFDRVELSNLNRQYYFPCHIGEYKAEALKDLINQLNPDIEIKSIVSYLNTENYGKILGDYNIICEAFDDPVAKADLVNFVLENMPDTKIVAGSGMGGYGNANNIKTKKITDKFYICGDGVTSFDEGIMSPCVMVCASHQADKIIKIIMEDK